MGAPQRHEEVMAAPHRSSMGKHGVSRTKGSNAPVLVVNGDLWETDTKKFNFSHVDKEILGKFLNINPEDIVSIELIYGPDATAIWGLHGTHGVIEIKSKSGYCQFPYMFKISH